MKRLFKRYSLEDYANSLKMQISKCSGKKLKADIGFVLDSEFFSYEKIVKLQFNIMIIILLIGIMVLVTIFGMINILLLKYSFLKYIILLVLVPFVLVMYFYFKLLLNYPTNPVVDYQVLLVRLRNEMLSFNKESFTITRILKKIDDLVILIKSKQDITTTPYEYYDTKTIVLIIDLLNDVGTVPKLNSSIHADIVGKLFGCSTEVFLDCINGEYLRDPKKSDIKNQIEKLKIIRIDFKDINFEAGIIQIDKKIKKLESKL